MGERGSRGPGGGGGGGAGAGGGDGPAAPCGQGHDLHHGAQTLVLALDQLPVGGTRVTWEVSGGGGHGGGTVHV